MDNNFNQNDNQQMYGQPSVYNQQTAYNQQPYAQQQPMYNQQSYAGQQYNYQQPMYNQQIANSQNLISRKEFVNLPQLHNIKTQIISSVVTLYICIALNVILIFTGYLSTVGLFDVAIMLISAIGIQITYNKAFGIIMLAYSIINVLIFLFVYGQLGGYLILVAGIIGFISTYKFDKAYNEYRYSGKLPNFIK